MDNKMKINSEIIEKANQMLIDKQKIDMSKFSRASQNILRNFSITSEELNRAFAKARRELESV